VNCLKVKANWAISGTRKAGPQINNYSETFHMLKVTLMFVNMR